MLNTAGIFKEFLDKPRSPDRSESSRSAGRLYTVFCGETEVLAARQQTPILLDFRYSGTSTALVH